MRAWQRGRTGYPIVDAGMRQLWHTGWMHNRVRMIAASFLIKHLLIDWRTGEAWFWDTLVDADPANNAASWQWVAGCGADAAPYFRIFNPVLQGEKFDPEGDYVRRWVPELARLPAAHIHAPWEAPAAFWLRQSSSSDAIIPIRSSASMRAAPAPSRPSRPSRHNGERQAGTPSLSPPRRCAALHRDDAYQLRARARFGLAAFSYTKGRGPLVTAATGSVWRAAPARSAGRSAIRPPAPG